MSHVDRVIVERLHSAEHRESLLLLCSWFDRCLQQQEVVLNKRDPYRMQCINTLINSILTFSVVVMAYPQALEQAG